MKPDLYSLHHKPIESDHHDALKEVFFLTSSKKEFLSVEEKDRFFYRWLGIYIELYTKEHFYITYENQLVAYLVACTDTLDFIETKASFPNKLHLFSDFYKDYPCHFHMNCHPKHQKKGLGKQLLKALYNDLMSRNINGVHLLTSPEMDNVKFYRKMSFTKEVTRTDNRNQFHFMGLSF